MQIKENIQAWNNVRNSLEGFHFLQAGNGLCIRKEEFQQWNMESNFVHLYLAIKNNEICFYLIDEYHDNAGEYIIGQTIFEKRFIKPNLQPKQQPPLKQNKANELTKLVKDLNQTLDNASNSPLSNQKEQLKISFNKVLDQLTTTEDLDHFHQALSKYEKAVVPSFRWLMYAPQWFEELAAAEQVVRAFEISLEDFQFLFDKEDCQEVFLFFALKNTLGGSFHSAIDLFLAQYDPQKDASDEIQFVIDYRTADISILVPPIAL